MLVILVHKIMISLIIIFIYVFMYTYYAYSICLVTMLSIMDQIYKDNVMY